ncbi:thiolase family protein, partial [Rhodopseudomonas sp. BR0C11]|nr:thiolase family protein [Rhodopseudomonas sp. BR0C11]
MSYITGVGLTPFGKIDGSTTLSLMRDAAEAALADAGLRRGDVEGVLFGDSPT